MAEPELMQLPVRRHVASFVVVLDHSLREEDAAALLVALKQIRGVASVQPVRDDVKLMTAREQVRNEFLAQIGHILRPTKEG